MAPALCTSGWSGIHASDPPLADWRRERAVSTPAKILAVSFLALSWSVMYLRDIADWLLATLAVLFLAVATFILTRPRPSRTGKQ